MPQQELKRVSKAQVDKILEQAGFKQDAPDATEPDADDKTKDKSKEGANADGNFTGQTTPGTTSGHTAGNDLTVGAAGKVSPAIPENTAPAGSGNANFANSLGSLQGGGGTLQGGATALGINNSPSGDTGISSNTLGTPQGETVTSLKQETPQNKQMSDTDVKTIEKVASAPAAAGAAKESASAAGTSSTPDNSIAKAITEGFKTVQENYQNTEQKQLEMLAEKLGIKKEATPSSRVNDDIKVRTERFQKAVEWFDNVGKKVTGMPVEHTWSLTKDEVMNRYFGVGYGSIISSTLDEPARRNEAVTVTGGDMPQNFANQIHRIPGGQIPLNVRPYTNFVDLTNQDRANWYKIDKTTVYTMAEGTEPTASSQTVTKITATPIIRVAYQKIGYTQIENAPFDLVQSVQDHMALNLINDEATDMLTTVYDVVTPSNWVNANTGATISTSDDIASMTFKREGLVAAKRMLANQGHDVRPGNLVLFLHPKAYQELMLDTNLNNYYQWAMPGITQRGILESLYGVDLVVANQITAKTNTTTNTYRNVLAVKGVGFGLASARDITFEAQKRNEIQQILITATQRVKSAVLDETATVRISSGQ